jgi:metal-responsive CopG/Arc/MetJ family transcriptional regulator
MLPVGVEATMATETAARRRAHVVLPEALIERIDALVGPRGRSQFIVEAAEQELRRRDRVAAFEEFAGSLVNASIPEWETAESTYRWVRRMRGHCDCDEGGPPA